MRVKRGYVLRRKHNRVLKLAKGFRGSRHRLFKTANEAVLHSLHYAYVGRRDRKNDFRKLWISRISAAAKANGISYSQLIHGLNLANIKLNRKMLSEIAISDLRKLSARMSSLITLSILLLRLLCLILLPLSLLPRLKQLLL